jgi:hypothetical protein
VRALQEPDWPSKNPGYSLTNNGGSAKRFRGNSGVQSTFSLHRDRRLHRHRHGKMLPRPVNASSQFIVLDALPIIRKSGRRLTRIRVRHGWNRTVDNPFGHRGASRCYAGDVEAAGCVYAREQTRSVCLLHMLRELRSGLRAVLGKTLVPFRSRLGSSALHARPEVQNLPDREGTVPGGNGYRSLRALISRPDRRPVSHCP